MPVCSHRLISKRGPLAGICQKKKRGEGKIRKAQQEEDIKYNIYYRKKKKKKKNIYFFLIVLWNKFFPNVFEETLDWKKNNVLCYNVAANIQQYDQQVSL